MATMGAILARRESRYETRLRLQEEYRRPVVVFTLNIPGTEKDSPFYEGVHKSGETAFTAALQERGVEILHSRVEYGACGREVFFVISSRDARLLKEICFSIEENHPLGRIFDLDVYDEEGNPYHRSDIGQDPRRCFLCDAPAAECARSRRHSLEELSRYIDSRIENFFQKPSPSVKKELVKKDKNQRV